MRQSFLVLLVFAAAGMANGQTSAGEPDIQRRLEMIERGQGGIVEGELQQLMTTYQNNPGVMYLQGVLTSDGTEATQSMEHKQSVEGAEFSKDESLILTRTGDGNRSFWKTIDGTPATQPKVAEKSISTPVKPKNSVRGTVLAPFYKHGTFQYMNLAPFLTILMGVDSGEAADQRGGCSSRPTCRPQA